jgi:hypothetical protein
VKCDLKRRNPRPKRYEMQEIFVVFAAIRQGKGLQIVLSRLPKEEKRKAKAKAKAREKGNVDGNCEEEKKEK